MPLARNFVNVCPDSRPSFVQICIVCVKLVVVTGLIINGVDIKRMGNQID